MKKLVGLFALLFLFSTITAAQSTWTIRTSAADNNWLGVTYGNGVFVAVAATGTGNRVMTSPDGITWTSRTSAANNQWTAVTYGNGLFVAVAYSGSGNRVMSSRDGITWTIRASAADNSWYAVTYGNGLFVAVAATGNRVMTSPDGITWTSRTAAANNQWTAVTYGNGLFVAVAGSGTGNRVMTSPDGITWTSRTSAADNEWKSVTYGNGLFVAVAASGTGNRVMTSPDGITWTIRTSAADNNWSAVAYGNGLFVAVSGYGGTGNRVMSSTDGITWTSRTSAADNDWFSVTYGNGLFVAVAGTGTGNRVMTSPEGINWTSRTSAANNNWYGVTYGNGLLVAVSGSGSGNRVMTGDLSVPPAAATASAPAPPPLQITPLGTMSISVVPNQSLLATGTATVVANQSGTWTATTSTPWLSLTQSRGAFPGVVAGTANAAGLAAGSYTGSISVAGTAVGGAQTITIPVTLTVNTPAALTANLTAISMASSYPAGSATGYTIQTGAPGLAFTASTSASSVGWLTVSPTSGIAPTPITVTLDPSKAIPGIYTDSILISSPGVASVSIPVKMAVSGFISTLSQQVNAATQAGPDHTVAPNEIVSLYLTDFSCATAPVVSVNGTAVSWSSYVAGQINYAVPANITSPAALTVACNGTTAWSFNGLTTAAVVPGIFTLTGTGKGQAAIVNSDGTTNSSTNPATRGSWLSVYGTGFGVFNAAGTNGLRTVAGNVTATIGGVDATVLYAGNTPGATDGLQQFNLQIPAGVTAGTAVPIVLTVNGTPTQTTATVSLQ